MKLFGRVTIIGFGLIGSSLARCIRKHGLADYIVAIDNDETICRKAALLGLADEAMADIRAGVEGSDLIVLALPAGECEAAIRQMQHTLKHGAIITDTSPVKESVIASVMPHLLDKTMFVPAHPFAGTITSGLRTGSDSLFQGQWCLITPLPQTDIRAVEKITALWEACGAIIEIMDAKRHDLVVSLTSHLPYLLACTLVGTAAGFEHDSKEEAMKFATREFRDFTNIAASDPVIWADTLLSNRDAVLEMLQNFSRNLSYLQEGIEQGAGDYLRAMFVGVRDIGNRSIAATATVPAEERRGAMALQKVSGSEA